MRFDASISDGILQVQRPGTRWLSTGWNGGFTRTEAAYNVSVPDGWTRTDVDRYVRRRRDRAGFDVDGPALLTGVDVRHARGARIDPVVAFATVGLTNPTALPVEPTEDGPDSPSDPPRREGTVNIVLGTTEPLTDGALADLLAGAVEARTATVLALTGFTGTTTDAVIVGCAADGSREPFAGSSTAVGSAARACTRDAVRASFRSRYADRPVPESVADAEHGVVTAQRAEVFRP